MLKLRPVIENTFFSLLVIAIYYLLYMIDMNHSTMESLLINVLTQIWLFTLCYALTWNTGRAILQTLLMTLAICFINILKVIYLDSALLPYDVYLIHLKNSYILLDYKLVGLSILFLIAALILPLGYTLAEFYNKKTRITFRKIIFFSTLLVISVSTFYIEAKRNEHTPFDLTEGIKQGIGTYLFMSLTRNENVSDHFPEKQSALFSDYLNKEDKAIEPAQTASTSQKPDIFLWLHESTVNPDIYCKFNAFKKLSLFSPTPYTQEEGWLRVHTFGGGTWLSEFSIFTGLNHTDFGEQGFSVFYSVVPKINYSLVKSLKKQGYYAVALNPLKIKNFYNAENAYYNLGFDEVLNPHDLGFKDEWRPADSVIVEALIKLWKIKKKIHKPLFIYGLSIVQHGPYDSRKRSRIPIPSANPSTLRESGLNARMTDYWDRIAVLSENTQHLETALLQQHERKVVLISFGDHHPNFWEQDRGATHHAFCGPRFPHPDYVTYYKIQDNFNTAPHINAVNRFLLPAALDITFLPSKLIQSAGLTMDNYFRANNKMSQLCNGALDDCPKQDLVSSYKSYLYHKMHAFSPQ